MYKSRNAIEKIRFECYKTRVEGVLIFPILLLFIAIFVRWVCGSPLSTLHYIGAGDIMPPIWLTVLLFSVSYIVAGLTLGLALGNRFCLYPERKYQGAMWFIIALALGYAWYPLFFCARLFLVSLIVCALCLFASICASICFFAVSRASFVFSVIYDVWLAYLLLLNLKVFFGI